jgi:hypothetical protein
MLSDEQLRVLDGRVRIKLRELKGSQIMAEDLQESLLNEKGVTYVEANPLTGNLLVLFESGVITGQKVLDHINGLAQHRPESQ